MSHDNRVTRAGEDTNGPDTAGEIYHDDDDLERAVVTISDDQQVIKQNSRAISKLHTNSGVSQLSTNVNSLNPSMANLKARLPLPPTAPGMITSSGGGSIAP